MKNLDKVLLGGTIFIGGYLVGFYEMKYKMLKVMVETQIKEKQNKKGEA